MSGATGTTSRRVPRGLTLAELSIALCITGVIAAAVCSFTFATATAWRSQEAGNTAEQLANLTAVRLNDAVQSARLFGAWTQGNLDNPSQTPVAAVMIWKADKNGDGQIQTSEILLLEFDPASGKLNARTRPAPKIDATWTYAQFTAAAGMDTMRTNAERNAVVGHLTGLEFVVRNADAPQQRPTLEYRLRTNVSGKVESFSGAAAMRAPSAVPN